MRYIPNYLKLILFKKGALVLYLMVIAVLALQLSAMGQPRHKTSKKGRQPKLISASQLSFAIIPSEGNTFGYDILDHNRKMIHQPSVPGIPGNKGFAKKADAEKVARLVMNKINHNQMPPTVSKHELDSLRIKL